MTVFIASMALTFGSLMAFVGPRHCGRGMHNHWQDHRMEAGFHHNGCNDTTAGSSTTH